jgi:hypothetical protein
VAEKAVPKVPSTISRPAPTLNREIAVIRTPEERKDIWASTADAVEVLPVAICILKRALGSKSHGSRSISRSATGVDGQLTRPNVPRA